MSFSFREITPTQLMYPMFYNHHSCTLVNNCPPLGSSRNQRQGSCLLYNDEMLEDLGPAMKHPLPLMFLFWDFLQNSRFSNLGCLCFLHAYLCFSTSIISKHKTCWSINSYTKHVVIFKSWSWQKFPSVELLQNYHFALLPFYVFVAFH